MSPPGPEIGIDVATGGWADAGFPARAAGVSGSAARLAAVPRPTWSIPVGWALSDHPTGTPTASNVPATRASSDRRNLVVTGSR